MTYSIWLEAIIESVAANEVLSATLKEIKEARPPEIHMFLAEILKLSKHSGNPFYGDTGWEANGFEIPTGTIDVRDKDHDYNEIYHWIHGGLHCFIVEALTHVSNLPPKSESVPLLVNFFDYFFNKRRGCTSCAKRVLALMLRDVRTAFLADKVVKRKMAYLGNTRHSPACMELSLWLMTISSMQHIDRLETMKLIASYNKHDASFLSRYSHQRSVRNFLKDYRLS